MRFCALVPLLALPLFGADTQLFPIHDGESCGYSLSSGSVVIAPRFRDCGSFSDGLAAVEVGDHWGYVDEKGATVIAPQFLAADGFSEGVAFVTLGDATKVVIDQSGKVLFHANYDDHGAFSDGLAKVEVVTRWFCPSQGLSIVSSCPDSNRTPVLGKYGYIDKLGVMVISPQFVLPSDFHEGLAYTTPGFIDHSGKVVIPGHFTSAKAFSGGVAPVQVDFKGWGYIDKSGAMLAQPVFDSAEPIQDGRGLVKQNGLYGYVDSSGSLVILPQFENALPFSEGRAAVQKDGKWGFIDSSGAVIIANRFDGAQSFHDGFATVAVGSHTVIIDSHGAEVASRLPTLAETFQRLQGFEVKGGIDGPLAEIIPILSVYKQQLRQLAVDSLRDSDDPDTIKGTIEAALRKVGVRQANDQEGRPYGLVVVEVVRPPQQTKLLIVLFHLNLGHAIDTSLSIFRNDEGAWELVFQLDRNDYYKWDLDAYHIAPPQFTASDKNGSFLMLMASDSGRSADGGYGLWIDLYRVAPPFRTDRLFHKSFGGNGHQVALDANGFRLETLSFEFDLALAGRRVFPYRYQVDGDQVTRVAPIGFDAHDFIGEWGNLPWEEASKLVNPARLETIHEFYNELRTKDGYFGGEFWPVQVCDPQGKNWQIAFTSTPNAKPVYFLVERTAKWSFILDDIGTTVQNGCSNVDMSRRPPQTMFDKPLEE